MYAGGISFRRLVLPFALAGLLLSFVTAGLNDVVVPAANHRAENIVQSAIERSGAVTQKKVLIEESAGDGLSQIIRADDLNLQTGELTNPVIVWFVKGRPAMITEAKRARWEKNQWIMYDGTNTTLTPEHPTTIAFPKWTADIPTTPQALAERSLSPEEMTYSQLKDRIRRALRQNEPTVELELTLYHKLSIPFACLVFALIAPPLGVRSHRGSSSIGMGIAILIGFGYYVIWHYLSAVAQQGHLTPFWAAWLPNIVTAFIGLGLILNVRK
jgi:lipopolysaccharide export system permease protein